MSKPVSIENRRQFLKFAVVGAVAGRRREAPQLQARPGLPELQVLRRWRTTRFLHAVPGQECCSQGLVRQPLDESLSRSESGLINAALGRRFSLRAVVC